MKITYNLTRSNRKTLAVYIRDGVLEVRSPLKLPKRDIDKFIISKQDWIAKKLVYSAEEAQSRKNFQLSYGDTVPYLGKEYPIVAKQDCCLGFDGMQFCVPPNLLPDQIKSVCAQIYRRLAKRDLPSRVFDFTKQMSVNPTAVKISDAKKCWGSCSSKKSLNFSWRLIMANSEAVDYVVVHELAHIMEMNHSARFWAIVEGILPDYRQRKAKLKELQQRLNKECWE